MNRRAEDEKKEPKEVRPFDIGDHLDNLLDMFGQGFGRGPLGGGIGRLMKMMNHMTSPALIDALPFSREVMNEDEIKGLDSANEKLVIIVLKDGDDDATDLDVEREKIEEIVSSVKGKLADVRNVTIKTAADRGPEGDEIRDAIAQLSDAYYAALRCAEAKINPISTVASMIRQCNPVVHRRALSDDQMQVISGVVSDLSAFIHTPGFFRSVADRIKDVYQNLRSNHDEEMEKKAFVTLRHPIEDFTGRQGFNFCPKFHSHMSGKASVPVEHSYCRDYCVEGRPEPDGSVTCKFAAWLGTIDTHEKAMARYPEEKNPANADMALRLPDGQRAHPKKTNAISLEGRMNEAQSHNTKQNVVKNYEALIGELTGGTAKRKDQATIQGRDSIERQLRTKSGETAPSDMSELRLKDKRDDASHGVGPENALENRLRNASPEHSFDHTKLIDELLEDEFPREDSKLPEE